MIEKYGVCVPDGNLCPITNIKFTQSKVLPDGFEESYELNDGIHIHISRNGLNLPLTSVTLSFDGEETLADLYTSLTKDENYQKANDFDLERKGIIE